MIQEIKNQDASEDATAAELNDEQVVQVWTNVAPQHPALSRIHEKLNKSDGSEASITCYDRMHHRHNRA